MKLIKIVKQLRAEGVSVEYKTRREGGIVITSINGRKFTAKAGNMEARRLTGRNISEKQYKHVKKATKAHTRRLKEIAQAKKQGAPIPPKPKAPKPQKVAVSKKLRKELRKAQRAFNQLPKDPNRSQGKPTIQRVRDIIKNKGAKEAARAIKEAQRYASGILYSGQIDFLITRIEDIALMNGDDPTTLINIIKRHKNTFKEDHFILFKRELYKYENGEISIATLTDQLRNIFKLTGENLKDVAHYVDVDPFDVGVTKQNKKPNRYK